MSRILIVCPYPKRKAPSQRFRYEQYLTYLEDNFVSVGEVSFWTNKQWPGIYGGKSIGYRVLSTVMAFIKRFFLLFTLVKYDTIFVHREASPIGPPWWEWCAAKIFQKRLIYDFDDAVWLPNSSKANAKLVGNLKNHGKIEKIISWSEIVFAGNRFLAEYALQFCADVRIVPTTIDLSVHIKRKYESQMVGHVRDSHKSPADVDDFILSSCSKTIDNDHSILTGDYPKLTIGWTGTHSSLVQLTPIFPLLKKVFKRFNFRFLLIADEAPDEMPKFVEFRKWRKETEIEDLLELDIGIMPLYDTDWERGKCGFKALQYMALEIPAVVSDVGVNSEIVKDGWNGFVCEALDDSLHDEYVKWERALLKLLTNEELRVELGMRGRDLVKSKYSVEAFEAVYLEALSNPEA